MKMMMLIFLITSPVLVQAVHADNIAAVPATGAPAPRTGTTRTIYPENQTIDFEGLSLEGELKAPGEFYFQNRNQERFDSLTKRRLNFRREMLRDSIQSD